MDYASEFRRFIASKRVDACLSDLSQAKLEGLDAFRKLLAFVNSSDNLELKMLVLDATDAFLQVKEALLQVRAANIVLHKDNSTLSVMLHSLLSGIEDDIEEDFSSD